MVELLVWRIELALLHTLNDPAPLLPENPPDPSELTQALVPISKEWSGLQIST